MNGPFTVHCQTKSPRAKPVVLPKGRVLTLGQPRVGESLVLVGEEGVVTTSVVRQLQPTPSGVVIDTDHSRYTLRHAAQPKAA
ncbi:MAG: hypothetical protein AAF721_22070 [Myxococcota bacterium]